MFFTPDHAAFLLDRTRSSGPLLAMVWPSVVILTVARIEQPSTRQDTTRARSLLDRRFILIIILERSSIVKWNV